MRGRTTLISAVAAVVVMLGGVGVSVASGGGSPRAAQRPGDIAASFEPAAKSRQIRDAAAMPLSADAGAQPNAGDPVNGYSFVPIAPFRAYDSRSYIDGYEIGNDGYDTYFTVLTDTNNNPRIPIGAVAVTYNLAITDTTGSGFMGVFPASGNWPGNASINWTFTGTTLSNGGTVAIDFYDDYGQVAVYTGPELGSVGTDFIMDITGYYI